MKTAKKSLVWLLTVLMLLSTVAMGVSAEDDAEDVVKLLPAVSETDDGANHWWVGTNVEVKLLDNGGFSIASIDGTIYNANVAWDFTYGQLKQTPYLNMTIGNQERESETPYMKMYFLIGTKMVTVKPFQNNLLEHWVKAGSVRGANCVNLLSAIDKAVPSLTDDTQIFMFLYQDPTSQTADPMGPLVVNELFLSDKKIVTTTTTTTTTTAATTVTTAQPDDNGNAGETDDGLPVGIVIAVAAAAVVLVGAVIVIVVKKKK